MQIGLWVVRVAPVCRETIAMVLSIQHVELGFVPVARKLGDIFPKETGVALTIELLNRAKAGDQIAMQAILDHYDQGPRKIITKLMSSEMSGFVQVADVEQFVRLRIALYVKSFEPRTAEIEKDFQRWVTVIATNHIRDAHTRRERFLASIEAAILAVAAEASAATPSRLVGQAEAFATLDKCVRALSQRDQSYIERFYSEELTDGEIAAQDQESEGAIRGRRGRALEQLRQCLGNSSDYRLG